LRAKAYPEALTGPLLAPRSAIVGLVNVIGIEVGAARTGSQPRCPFCREDLADLPACECSTCAAGYLLGWKPPE
tara:strand:- start:981 stop:1202 length:222 start_codon:yes stop_codon:yes gene_type:complete